MEVAQAYYYALGPHLGLVMSGYFGLSYDRGSWFRQLRVLCMRKTAFRATWALHPSTDGAFQSIHRRREPIGKLMVNATGPGASSSVSIIPSHRSNSILASET
jgi:hypothetical protein